MMPRTSEELAQVLYGGPAPAPPAVKKPPAPEVSAAAVVRDLLGRDDRLMELLEADIERMERQLEAEQQEADRNFAQKD